MSLSVYKVQNVLQSYQKQLKTKAKECKKEDTKIADVVTISNEGKKKNTTEKMGKQAIRNLHDWALKPFKKQ